MQHHNDPRSRTTKSLASVTAVLLAAVLWQCRQGQDSASSTQSVDNFVAGTTVTENQCGYDFRGAQDAWALTLPQSNNPKDTVDLRTRFDGACADQAHWADAACAAAFGVLAAVPPQLTAPFFVAFNGRITVGGDAPCARPELTGAEKDFTGTDLAGQTYWCQAAGEPAHLYLPADTAVIRHSLLRLFAYFYTERFAPAVAALPDSGQVSPAAMAQEFVASAKSLATTLVDEVGTGTAAGQRLAKFQHEDADRFANYAFAEMIDSRYCSGQSNGNFQSEFKNTYAAFLSATQGWPAPRY